MTSVRRWLAIGAVLAMTLGIVVGVTDWGEDPDPPLRECRPELTDQRGRPIPEPTKARLRDIYGRYGIDASFLDGDYHVEPAGVRWTGADPSERVLVIPYALGADNYTLPVPGVLRWAELPEGIMDLVFLLSDGRPVCGVSRFAP